MTIVFEIGKKEIRKAKEVPSVVSEVEQCQQIRTEWIIPNRSRKGRHHDDFLSDAKTFMV